MIDLDVLKGSSYNEQEPSALDWQQKVFDNWSRELLRLLPGQLIAAVERNIQDENLRIVWREVWKEGAGTQLHDILRAALKKIGS